MAEKNGYSRKFPKNALRLTTGCQYCSVGCGYNSFLVPENRPDTRNGGDTWDGVSRTITPAMRNTIRYKGKTWQAAVAPDVLCDLNKGNHSVRGGSQGHNLVTSHEVNASGNQASTKERLISPSILCLDKNKKPVHEEIAWQTLNELMARLIIMTTDMQVNDSRQIQVNSPEKLGAKLYEYQYLENTFAATKLLYNCIGTPNVAYHDRPSAGGSSPGMKDVGFRPHDFSYEEVRACDLLVFIGTNPYENQSVFFMQQCVGKEMIVIDPRKTATAQYAEQTGGFHLQPARLGADSVLIYALCRALIEQWEETYGSTLKKKELLHHERIIDRIEDLIPEFGWEKLAENDKERYERMRRGSRAMTYPDLIDFLKDEVFSLDRALKTAGLTQLAGEPLNAATFKEKIVSRFFEPIERKGFKKIGIFYEKGMIWGFNYHNTASVANLGLLLGAYAEYGRFVGRVGGHQKGWAAAKCRRTDVEKAFVVAMDPTVLNRFSDSVCTSDKLVTGEGGPAEKAVQLEGYPYRSATDCYSDKHLKNFLETIRKGVYESKQNRAKFKKYQELCGDQEWIKVPHNLDNHVFGVMEPEDQQKKPAKAADELAPGTVKRVQLPNGLVTNTYPDVDLLWIIGGNYFGQNNQAQAKRERLEKRLRHTEEFLPKQADVKAGKVDALMKVYEKRLAAGNGFDKGLVTVHQDLFSNPTTYYCDIVIPAAGWGEDSFIRYNAQRRLKLYDRFQDMPLHPSEQSLPGDPFDHIERENWRHSPKPDWLIFKSIAREIGKQLDVSDKVNPLFDWNSSGAIADEMVEFSNRTKCLGTLLEFANTRSLDPKLGKVHQILGYQIAPSDFANGVYSPHLREGYEVELEAGEPGTGNEMVYQNGFTTNGVIHPLRYDHDRKKLIGRLRGVKRSDKSKLCFIRAPWEGLVKKTFDRELKPGVNEILITNGRVNHLWNNMFHHIRNAYVNARYPSDLPGTVLEVGEGTTDQDKTPLKSGQVVEVIHATACFMAVVSIQDSIPANLAFAMFSYPVNIPNEKRGRIYTFDGYVNNITNGYTDGINPIAALKYGKARIKLTPNKYVLPTFEQRSQIRGCNQPTPPGQILSEKERLGWEMRELVVTKGLPRAFIHPKAFEKLMLEPDAMLEYLAQNPGIRAGFIDALESRMTYPRDPTRALCDRWNQIEINIAKSWNRSLDSGKPMPKNVSFQSHIFRMFTDHDIAVMRSHNLELSSYDVVKDRYSDILERLETKDERRVMPPPPPQATGPWPNEWIKLFKRWKDEGFGR